MSDDIRSPDEAIRDRCRTLGLAFVMHGMIIGSWALFCVFGGLMLGTLGLVEGDFLMMLPLGGFYFVLAAYAAVASALQIWAGVQLRRGTGLLWAMGALALAVPGLVLALYCGPFTLGLMIYALVVLVDKDVRAYLDPA